MCSWKYSVSLVINSRVCWWTRNFKWKHLAHGLRMSNDAFFHLNADLLDLGRQIRQINFWAFGVFSAELSAPILDCDSLVHVFHYSTQLFLQKPLYPHPKYLFGLKIWIRVSVVRALSLLVVDLVNFYMNYKIGC